MALSGFAGLGYQVFFAQKFATWLGHEMVSVLAVVAAFFGGIALGAWQLSGPICKTNQPYKWYVGCELAIAVWGIALIVFMEPANAILATLTGPQPNISWQWTVAFLGPFLLILPSTIAMGATLPAIEQMLKSKADIGFSIGYLYSSNTFGAVIGVLGTTFILTPKLGLNNTALVCVSVNLLCAAVAWRLFAASPAISAEPDAHVHVPSDINGTNHGFRLFLTGLLGISFEVLVVRVLNQVTENTVYTFAILLSVYLLATAFGAGFYQRWGTKYDTDSKATPLLLCALIFALLCSFFALSFSENLMQIFSSYLGAGVIPKLAAEAFVAATVFAAPSCCMGALFSHFSVQAKKSGWQFGTALSVNTLGAAIAPFVAGVLLFPLLGAKLLLILICAGYMFLIPSDKWSNLSVWSLVIACALTAGFATPLVFVDVPPGGKLVSYREGVAGSVSVVENAQGIASLHINNREREGSTATGLADARLAYLPLLLHAQPSRALFLGVGTGITTAAAAESGKVTVDAVELLPEVIASTSYFLNRVDTSSYANSDKNRPTFLVSDARRYVRSTDKFYDVIVSDLFHPARKGAGSLYTVEHFEAIKQRLAKEGLFCQWLPLHQIDEKTLAVLVQTFLKVFPNAVAVLASNSLTTPVLGLVARPEQNKVNAQLVKTSLQINNDRDRNRRAALQLYDEFAILGSIVASTTELTMLAQGAPLNTDDNSLITQLAPLAVYENSNITWKKFSSLIAGFSPKVSDVFLPAASLEEAQILARIQNYWDARNKFIALGSTVRASDDIQKMLAQLRQPLIKIILTSPDFRPAYDPLLNIASSLAMTDKTAARSLYYELGQINPQRNEARKALEQLDGN
jgi:spermidine synthase